MARTVCFSCIGLFFAIAVACSGTTHIPRDAVVTHSESGKADKPPDPVTATSKVDESPKETERPTHATKVQRVTLHNYYRIRDGMTGDQVSSILGPPTSENASGGGIGIYTWNAAGINGLLGGNMNVTFQNGRVIGKAQAELPLERKPRTFPLKNRRGKHWRRNIIPSKWKPTKSAKPKPDWKRQKNA